jgi:hypothetical protein
MWPYTLVSYTTGGRDNLIDEVTKLQARRSGVRIPADVYFSHLQNA